MKKYFTTMILLFAAIVSNQLVAQNVTSGADDGSDGTLRAEILDTPAGGEITFGILVTQVTLEAELVIDKELTISGGLAGVGMTTINANENGRAFTISAGTVVFNNLSIIDGDADDGGGIFISGGDLTINDSEITGCEANGESGSGGAIYVDQGASLTVNDSEISGNRANRAGGGIEDNSGAGLGIVLDNVNLNNNNAGVAPAVGNPGNGGGLHVTGAGDVQITDGTVNNNLAALEGGGLWNGTGTMTIEGAVIDGNSAQGDAADDGGGGIFNNGGILTINNTEVTDNEAIGDSGSGGGIFNNDGGTLTVTNSEISGNTSNRAGGGIEDASGANAPVILTEVNLDNNTTGNSPGNGGGLHVTGNSNITITGGSVIGNTAAKEGGGLWNNQGILTINGTTISSNVAQGDFVGPDPGPLEIVGGGGIFSEDGAGSVIINEGTTISGNFATGTQGSGGGILMATGTTLTINGTDTNPVTLSGNAASRAGGGIEDWSLGDTTNNLDFVIFDLNTVGLDAGDFIADGGPGNGGAIHVTGPAINSITNGSATGNLAASEGGGFWNNLGTMTIDGVTIDGNSAAGDAADNGGGGVFNDGGTLTIRNQSEITNNSATGTSGSGGGLLSVGGPVIIVNSTFDSNAANRAGGAVEIIDGDFIFDRSIMSNNDVNGIAGTANPGNGGAFHVSGMTGNVTFSRTVITGNQAAAEGGGLWNQSGRTMNIDRSTIDGNIAAGTASDNGGGGVFNNGGIINITASTISNNNATASTGGGLLNAAGTTNISRSTVSGNTATTSGGGITNNDQLDINAVTIALNTATVNGGGVASTSTTTVKNSIIGLNIGAGGQDVSGSFTSNGFNVVGIDDSNSFPEQGTDTEETAPLLGPLQDNGGETFTHELQTGSVGIDAGDPADNFLDQRNFSIINARDIGSFERDGVLGVGEVEAITTSIIYPNPSNGSLTVEIQESVVGEINMKVVSITGKVVQQVKLVTGANTINLTGLASGMYIVNISSDNTQTSHKLILN